MDATDVRTEMEDWLKQAGVNKVLGKKISLADPPAALIEKAAENGDIIVVQPAGCTAADLSEAFGLMNWASVGLETLSSATADKDLWFTSPAEDVAPYAGESPDSVAEIAASEGKKGMSLEQYILFAARFKALRGNYPDVNYWTWLLESHEQTLVLFAGFDTYGNLQINSCTSDYVDDNTGCRLITIRSS